jgi:hypothetical protein
MLWSWVLRLVIDAQLTKRVAPFVTCRIYLDGRRMARDYTSLLPNDDDANPSAYLERVRKRTRRAPTLIVDGVSSTSWDIVDATQPMLARLRPPCAPVDLRFVLRDHAAPSNPDTVLLGDDHASLRAQIGRSLPFNAALTLQKLLFEACRSSIRGSDPTCGDITDVDLAIAELRRIMAEPPGLWARVEAHRLCWESAHGFEKTPPLKCGSLPNDVWLTTKHPEAIAASLVDGTLLLACWGHSFEISRAPHWVLGFVCAVRQAERARLEALCADIPPEGCPLARELVDALWSANAFEVHPTGT